MKRFVTEYTGDDGHRYSGHVDALDEAHAQRLCDERRPGEKVSGILFLVVPGNTPIEKVHAMIERMEAGLDQEPPDAEAFVEMDR
jgi:hypothetical protein